MTRRLSFRAIPAPTHVEAEPWPSAALRLVLIVVLSWVACIGTAWLVAGAAAVVAGVFA